MLAASGAALGASGCSFGPGLSAGFDAPDEGAKLHATAEAGRAGDREAIPELIEGLESDDPAVRMLSIGSLERLTGERLGYGFADPEGDRQAAVQRWRAWRADQEDADGSGTRRAGRQGSDRAVRVPNPSQRERA